MAANGLLLYKGHISNIPTIYNTPIYTCSKQDSALPAVELQSFPEISWFAWVCFAKQLIYWILAFPFFSSWLIGKLTNWAISLTLMLSLMSCFVGFPTNEITWERNFNFIDPTNTNQFIWGQLCHGISLSMMRCFSSVPTFWKWLSLFARSFMTLPYQLSKASILWIARIWYKNIFGLVYGKLHTDSTVLIDVEIAWSLLRIHTILDCCSALHPACPANPVITKSKNTALIALPIFWLVYVNFFAMIEWLLRKSL